MAKTSVKYVSNVHRTAQGGGADSEIKRTIKASKIQRDVVRVVPTVTHTCSNYIPCVFIILIVYSSIRILQSKVSLTNPNPSPIDTLLQVSVLGGQIIPWGEGALYYVTEPRQ